MLRRGKTLSEKQRGLKLGGGAAGTFVGAHTLSATPEGLWRNLHRGNAPENKLMSSTNSTEARTLYLLQTQRSGDN